MMPPFLPLLWAVIALALVIGLIWLLGQIARTGKWLPRPTGQRLAVIAAIPLEQRRRLQLIRCDDRMVLLLTGPTDLVLGWLPTHSDQDPMMTADQAAAIPRWTTGLPGSDVTASAADRLSLASPKRHPRTTP